MQFSMTEKTSAPVVWMDRYNPKNTVTTFDSISEKYLAQMAQIF